MTKNKAIAMAIEAIRRLANDLYGIDSKYHPDQKVRWDKWQQAIKILEELRDVSQH
jgi:hypothetical protein